MIQTIPGLTGFAYGRFSSLDKRAVGKLTDSNHLETLRVTDPADYDKKIISIYTQTGLYANDFLDMINKSTPFYIETNSDSWKWQVSVPYQFPKIVDIPPDTAGNPQNGIDGKTFQLVLDSNEFGIHSKVVLGNRMYGPQLYVVSDPTPYDNAWLYTFQLISENPLTDFVPTQFLRLGVEVQGLDNIIGEFDQDLPGLPRLGEKITLYESLSSAYGRKHTITKWADERTLRDKNGNPLDILVYYPMLRGSVPDVRKDVRWEPLVEYLMRVRMLEDKVSRFIWSKPGTVRSGGSKQELKRSSAGVYHRMRTSGNLVQYNRGEFSSKLLRTVFGDLFYGRVDIANRKVKIYTNEAGMDVFQQAIKEDAMNSGVTFFSNINAADQGNASVTSNQFKLTYGFSFNSMISRETGRVDVFHLKELDIPQPNLEFGTNRKTTPIFFIFDVSPNGDGSLTNNIREVRHKGSPSMTWGYIDGRQHHLGFARSQGMSSASMFPGYTIWMEDRCDVFVEDLSRTVLIEEIPQF